MLNMLAIFSYLYGEIDYNLAKKVNKTIKHLFYNGNLPGSDVMFRMS